MKKKAIFTFVIAFIMAVTVITPLTASNAYAAKKPGTPKGFYSVYAKWCDKPSPYGSAGVHACWGDVSGAKGYQITVYGDKFKTKTWSVSDSWASSEPNHWGKMKKVKRGQKVWVKFKVRAYKKSGKKKVYGNWSKVQSCYFKY